jgi:glycine dehydrogenase subunit 1
MLKSIGAGCIDELFNDIPEQVQLKRRLNLNSPISEIELTEHMRKLAEENTGTDKLTCFLGAGAYDHYIPSVIKHIISRSEFYTAYTPYQAEISQGTLQTIFEYQTMISSLTGMEVSNASMYDGATSSTEAMIMACESTKRKSVIISKTVHPEVRRVIKTYLKFRNIEVIEVEHKGGETDIEKLKDLVSDSTAGVLIQNPNFFGIIESTAEIEKIVHGKKALLVMSVNPISLGVLKTPGEYGADIAVGEGQCLGNSLSFGGPYLGFMATNTKLMRKMPGRIVGQTVDADGKRAYVLTLQAREQHIRRHKATSNICSNQALNALTAAIYLTIMGKQGIKEVASQCFNKAHYAYDKITALKGYKPVFNKK